jgi:hypothetical protein
MYGIVVLEECNSREQLVKAEKWWIAFARAWGCRLTNMTDGGDGAVGTPQSPEVREKHRVALKGKPKSIEHRMHMSLNNGSRRPEVKEKLRLANLGKKATVEARAKMSAAHRLRYQDPREREKTAETSRGRRHSPETLKKMSDSQKGKIISIESRIKMSIARRGKIPWNKGLGSMRSSTSQLFLGFGDMRA